MLEKFRQSLLFYAQHLYTVDFLFIFLAFFVFIVFLVFAIMLSKRPMIAGIVIVWDFVICYYLIFDGYAFLDSKVRTREAEIVKTSIANEINFAVDFNITNLSKYNFSFCKITSTLYKEVDEEASFIEKYKNKLRAYRIKSKTLDSLKRGETQNHRIVFEDFNQDLNISSYLKSECY